MLTSGPTVFGFRRREHQEEQDEEKSEFELPEQHYSRFPLLGSCSSSTIGDTRMKDSIEQAGGKALQRSEVSVLDPQQTGAEPMTGSSLILGFESGRVYPEQDVDERDPNLVEQVYIGASSGLTRRDPNLLEQVYVGASSGLTRSSTSGFEITTDLGEFEAEIAEQKGFTEKALKEFKPLDQEHDESSGFSGAPSSFLLRSGRGKEQESELLDEVDIGASSGHTESTTSGFGIRTDLREFEAEIAEQKDFAEKTLKEFKPLDQQRDEVLGLAGVPSSAVLMFGRRKSEGYVAELPFADEEYIRVQRLKSSPIFGFHRKDHGKHVVDEVESDSLSEPEKSGISTVANRAVVRFRGKQQRRELDEGSPSRMEMKAISLPEELVEKILSMIPFPDFLKTRVLNKSWNLNFSARPEALVFQNQVKAVASRWKHYCPVILNIEKEWLVGYDREYNRWQNMPLGFEREGLRNWFSTQKLRGAGSLMCGVFNRSNVFVTNIVTRTWKWLPSRPDMAYPKEIHLLPIGSDAYQVLLITKNERDPTEVSCQLYDSRMESWTVKQSTVSTALFNSSSAYLDGVLYVMEYDPDDFHDVMKMLSYNVKDGIWMNIHHPFGSMLHEIETYELLVCQNHLMVVLHLHPTWWTTNKIHNTLRNTLMVYKLDPVSLDIREIARGPPEPMSASCTLFASDNDSIYFGNPQVIGSSVVELNLQSKEWICLPPPTCADGSFKNKWATFPFQPGMNPFVSV